MCSLTAHSLPKVPRKVGFEGKKYILFGKYMSRGSKHEIFGKQLGVQGEWTRRKVFLTCSTNSKEAVVVGIDALRKEGW